MLQRRRASVVHAPVPSSVPFPFLSRVRDTRGRRSHGGKASAATFSDHHSRSNNDHRGTRVIGTWRRGSVVSGNEARQRSRGTEYDDGGGGEGGEQEWESVRAVSFGAKGTERLRWGFLETTHVRLTRHRLLNTGVHVVPFFFPSRTTRPRESERRRRRSRGSRLLPRQRLHDTHCTQ